MTNLVLTTKTKVCIKSYASFNTALNTFTDTGAVLTALEAGKPFCWSFQCHKNTNNNIFWQVVGKTSGHVYDSGSAAYTTGVVYGSGASVAIQTEDIAIQIRSDDAYSAYMSGSLGTGDFIIPVLVANTVMEIPIKVQVSSIDFALICPTSQKYFVAGAAGSVVNDPVITFTPPTKTILNNIPFAADSASYVFLVIGVSGDYFSLA